MAWTKLDAKRVGRAKYGRGFCTSLVKGKNRVLSFHQDDIPDSDSVDVYYNEGSRQLAVTEGDAYRLGRMNKSARRYITATHVLNILGVKHEKGKRYPVMHGEVDGKRAAIVDFGGEL